MSTQPTFEQSGQELVAWFTQTAQQGTGFLVEQAPLYVQEYLGWVFWSSAFIAGVAATVGVASFLVFVLSSRSISRNGENEANVPGFIAGGIISFVCLMIFCIQTYEAAQAKIAPRVVIVEHAQRLINR